MQFNKTTLRQFRSEFAQAVAELEQKHNIKIDLGNIRFDETSFKSQMSVVNLDATPDGVNPEEAKWYPSWERNYFRFGFDKDELGIKFRVTDGTPKANGEYKLIGIKPKVKYNLAVININTGKISLFPNSWITPEYIRRNKIS